MILGSLVETEDVWEYNIYIVLQVGHGTLFTLISARVCLLAQPVVVVVCACVCVREREREKVWIGKERWVVIIVGGG